MMRALVLFVMALSLSGCKKDESTDCERHIDWIFKTVQPHAKTLKVGEDAIVSCVQNGEQFVYPFSQKHNKAEFVIRTAGWDGSCEAMHRGVAMVARQQIVVGKCAKSE